MRNWLWRCSLLLVWTRVDAGPAAAAANALRNMDYRYFVAGGVCAATSHGITTPIDVVKTRMQAQPEVYNKGIRHAAVSVCKTDGPGALLGGLGPTVVGYGLEGAMKFGVYEVLKHVFTEIMEEGSPKATAYILASVMAGAVASLFLCPMESTRIKIVTDSDYAQEGLVGGLHKLIRTEGFLSTFGGMYAMLAKQVPYTMAKQVSFDLFASLFYKLLGNVEISVDILKWIVSVSAAFMASLFACIFSQPGDMILTETYGSGGVGKSFPSIVKEIYERNGVASFFTGTGARILHVGMIITSQLVIYDIVKQLLGLPATGSH